MAWPFWENFNHCNSGLFIITRQKKERTKLKAPRMNTLLNDNKDQFCLNFNATGTITNNNCKWNKGFNNKNGRRKWRYPGKMHNDTAFGFLRWLHQTRKLKYVNLINRSCTFFLLSTRPFGRLCVNLVTLACLVNKRITY